MTVLATPRQRLRAAKNYVQLVKDIQPLAADGNAEAQYVMAEALRWCDKTLHLYFVRPNGQIRTLDDVEAARALRPAGVSTQELESIYSRCHGFLEDPGMLTAAAAWSKWLDKSASQNYPAATAEKAEFFEEKLATSSPASVSPDSTKRTDAEKEAQETALQAAESSDPVAIFLMSDWVRGGDRTPAETATLIGAWQILACQKGYDCGEESDFMHTVCDWDPQCADGRTYTDYFQRQLGTGYDDAVAIAKAIDKLIAAKDVEGLRSYL